MPDLRALIDVLVAIERQRQLKGNPEIGRCAEEHAIRRHLRRLETNPSGPCAEAHGDHGSAAKAAHGSRYQRVGHA